MRNWLNTLIFGALVLVLLGGYYALENSNVDILTIANTQEPATDSITLLFTGDMMFDRGVRKTINAKGFDIVFGDSKKIFSGAEADLVIANLEGPITSYPSRILRPDGTTSSELNFTFQTETAKALKDNNIDIVNLANNHTANQGAEGLIQTKKYLQEAMVGYFGHPGNKETELATTTCKDNFCISLIGWHEFAATPASSISTKIKELRSTSDIVVVLPHWGEEYKKTPSTGMQTIAHQWIDAGADMIIGTHPHIIESIEEYKGKAIFYSLGNYIFDQYFSFDTTHGLVVAVTAIKNSSTSTISFDYKLIPIKNVATVVSIPDENTSSKILTELSKISAQYLKTIKPGDILKGAFRLPN